MPILTNQRGGFNTSGGGMAANLPQAGPAEASWGPDQEAIAKTQANAAMYPATLRNQHFQQLFPYFANALGSLGNGGLGPFSAGGSQIGTQPEISAGPVLNPQQVQQQVNQQRAQTDAATFAQQRQQQESAGGRGFGAGSPLTMALQGQAANQGLAQNAANETSTRLGAAQMNAGQLLKGQQAREQQFASRQMEDVERRKPVLGLYGALLGSLGGMI